MFSILPQNCGFAGLMFVVLEHNYMELLFILASYTVLVVASVLITVIRMVVVFVDCQKFT